MSEMFNNYPQPEDYIPNNRPRFCPPHTIDIMTGETAIHTFEIPFNVHENCDGVEMMYKQGVEIIISKAMNELDLTEDEHSCVIGCKLMPEETAKFNRNVLNTNVQIKFTMKDGGVIYSEIYPVKVSNSLEVSNNPSPSPAPGTLGGIGYTED